MATEDPMLALAEARARPSNHRIQVDRRLSYLSVVGVAGSLQQIGALVEDLDQRGGSEFVLGSRARELKRLHL